MMSTIRCGIFKCRQHWYWRSLF